ncbi:Ty1/Copia family ribonuclease HI [bacterium]|nr:Ty1/Copia family ribonuclease HI [bacterium]
MARAKYLSADRPDLMYAVQELCRGMAKPTRLHWHKLKRLGRCLVDHSRTLMKYEWQGDEPDIAGYSDSDWAGCRVTGKSTSGGPLMIGSHFRKGRARTQHQVTLSSAAAELVALVKCSTELLGARSLMRDLGMEKVGVVYADSSAAAAIAKRQSAGKLWHINISCLWIQEKQDTKQLELRKVLGTGTRPT